MIQKEGTNLIYSNLWIKNKDNIKKILTKKKLPQGRIYKEILKNYQIYLSASMFHSNIFKKENYKFDEYEIIQDFDLFYRLSKFHDFSVIQEPLIIYRSHENMISKKKFELHIQEWEKWISLNENEIGPFDILKIKNETSYNRCKIYQIQVKLKIFYYVKIN